MRTKRFSKNKRQKIMPKFLVFRGVLRKKMFFLKWLVLWKILNILVRSFFYSIEDEKVV
jgi:hypothetical protein